MIVIKRATNTTHFKTIEKLANAILHEVYDPIITAEHTNYFLSEFQSEKAIENQIKNENFSYFLLSFNAKNVGYIGLQNSDKKLILSKLYILKSFRGLQIGKTALAYVNQFALNHKFEKIKLIVNQQNLNPIRIYKKNGFKIIKAVTNYFPNGYAVEDYIMEKTPLLK